MFSIPVAAASGRGVLRFGESSANRIHTFKRTLHFVTSSLLQEIAVVEHARKASVHRNFEIDGTCRVKTRAEDPGKSLSRNRKVGAENRFGIYSLRYSRTCRIAASTKLWSGGRSDVDAVNQAYRWLAAWRQRGDTRSSHPSSPCYSQYRKLWLGEYWMLRGLKLWLSIAARIRHPPMRCFAGEIDHARAG